MSLNELKSLAQRQELKRADLVWAEGMAAWQQAGMVAGVFEGLPPDLETPRQTVSTPSPSPVTKTDGSHSEAKPILIGGGVIALAVILIMFVIHQKQKAEQDQTFDRFTQDVQNAGQNTPQSDDPAHVRPP